jgi:hypothetical protein
VKAKLTVLMAILAIGLLADWVFLAGRSTPLLHRSAAPYLQIRAELEAAERISLEFAKADLAGRRAIVEHLEKEATLSYGDPSRLARSVLSALPHLTAEEAREHMARANYLAAARSWEAHLLADPGSAWGWYGLARARAGSGDRAGALDALGRAVGNGFREADRMEREPFFRLLGRDARFEAALAAARARPPAISARMRIEPAAE